jgi:MFS family permease
MTAWIAFLRANARFLSFGFTTNMCLAVGQTYFVSLFNTAIQRDLALNHGQMASLYGAATVIGAVGIAPAGRLLDAVDLRLFMTLVIVLTAGSCVAMAEATSVPVLFLAMVGVRFFAGTVLGVSAQATMARYFDLERGRAAAIANMGYTASYAVFPFVVTALIAAYGWRTAWGFFAAAFILLVLPLTLHQLRGHGDRHRRYLARLADSAAVETVGARSHFTLGEVLRDGRFYMIMPGLLAVPCLLFTFQYHQLALVQEKGWPLQTFAAAYLLFSAVSFVANVAAGAIVDRFGSRGLMTSYLWPLIPALAVVAWADGAWAIPVYMVCSALTFGFNLVTGITIWSDLYGTRHIGAIRGFNAALNTLVASLGMALAGWLIDRGVTLATQASYGMAATIVAALMLYAVGRRLPRRRRE